MNTLISSFSLSIISLLKWTTAQIGPWILSLYTCAYYWMVCIGGCRTCISD